MLDVTGSGTVIVRSPLSDEADDLDVDVEIDVDVDVDVEDAPEPVRDDVLVDIDVTAIIARLTVELEAEDALGEQDDDSIEAGEIELDGVGQHTVVTGPVEPRPFWEAPARGNTAVERHPTVSVVREAPARGRPIPTRRYAVAR